MLHMTKVKKLCVCVCMCVCVCVCECVHRVSEPMPIASIPSKNTLSTLQLVWFNM